jgi:hypothetical protein
MRYVLFSGVHVRNNLPKRDASFHKHQCCFNSPRSKQLVPYFSNGIPPMIYQNVLCVFLAALATDVENGTQVGKFVVEHPTLLNLGFEWQIQGDANRNATVVVQFRKMNDPEWRQALPLVRIGGERVYRERENLDYTVPEGFAGSILNLQPGTEYECRFELTDPDGAQGDTTQTVRVKTRSEPQPFKDGRGMSIRWIMRGHVRNPASRV